MNTQTPIDSVIRNKSDLITHSIARAREEYAHDPGLANNATHHDAANYNIQRACQAALDVGQHLLHRDRLGVPQSAQNVFALLAQAGRIDASLAASLKHMVDFRQIVLHDDLQLQPAMTIAIIEKHLDDFLQFTRTLILHDATQNQPK